MQHAGAERIALAEHVRNDELGVRVDRDPGPHPAVVWIPALRARHVALFGRTERPNLVGLDALALEVPHRIVQERPAGIPYVGEQLQHGAFGRAGHPAGSTDAIAFNQGREDASSVVNAQAVHTDIMHDRSSIVKNFRYGPIAFARRPKRCVCAPRGIAPQPGPCRPSAPHDGLERRRPGPSCALARAARSRPWLRLRSRRRGGSGPPACLSALACFQPTTFGRNLQYLDPSDDPLQAFRETVDLSRLLLLRHAAIVPRTVRSIVSTALVAITRQPDY
jgi:hypothetical protein